MQDNDHYTEDECPTAGCTGEIYHQNFGRGKSPALVCDTCDYTAWMTVSCITCDKEWAGN